MLTCAIFWDSDAVPMISWTRDLPEFQVQGTQCRLRSNSVPGIAPSRRAARSRMSDLYLLLHQRGSSWQCACEIDPRRLLPLSGTVINVKMFPFDLQMCMDTEHYQMGWGEYRRTTRLDSLLILPKSDGVGFSSKKYVPVTGKAWKHFRT